MSNLHIRLWDQPNGVGWYRIWLKQSDLMVRSSQVASHSDSHGLQDVSMSHSNGVGVS